MRYIPFTKVKLPYGLFGNMSPHPVVYDGKIWRTSEALFQSLRFDSEEIKEAIRLERSPMGAKLKAKSLKSQMVVTPLSRQDVDNMKMVVRLKVEQHRDVQEALKNTEDAIIYEDVAARGNVGSNLFWGAMLQNGELIGQNVLGEILMEIREELLPANYS